MLSVTAKSPYCPTYLKRRHHFLTAHEQHLGGLQTPQNAALSTRYLSPQRLLHSLTTDEQYLCGLWTPQSAAPSVHCSSPQRPRHSLTTTAQLLRARYQLRRAELFPPH